MSADVCDNLTVRKLDVCYEHCPLFLLSDVREKDSFAADDRVAAQKSDAVISATVVDGLAIDSEHSGFVSEFIDELHAVLLRSSFTMRIPIAFLKRNYVCVKRFDVGSDFRH